MTESTPAGGVADRKVTVLVGFRLAPEHVESLREEFPQVDFLQSRSRADLFALAPLAEVFFGWPEPELLAGAPHLRWVHILGAGADGIDPGDMERRGVVVTNSRGIGANNIAEHALALMLTFARSLHLLGRAQQRCQWLKSGDLKLFELQGQTLGILGLGSIGQALALKASALGMRVIGTRRSGQATPGVSEVYDSGQTTKVAAQADHLVVCLPRTSETRHAVDASVFRVMPPGSYFYNVGRGWTVQHEDLIAALKSGHLGGAGLDVVDPEPLPKDSPLWQMENVVITCHTAGNTSRYWDRGVPLFAGNLRAFLEGQPLRNVVDVRRGY